MHVPVKPVNVVTVVKTGITTPVSNTTFIVDDEFNAPPGVPVEGVRPIVQIPTEPEFSRAGVKVTAVAAVAAVIVTALGLTRAPSEDVDTPKPVVEPDVEVFVMLVSVTVPVAEAARAHVSPSVIVTT